uniref:glutathione transferase n=1 Tax=Vombatus ursinus TaxID=29139 RepID=A0A4X2L437_VOMUR
GPPCLGLLPCSGFTPAACPLLEYTGANYEEKVYHFGDAPDFDKSQWLDVKFSLGLDFPNLPYLIDGDHKITQSSAILRYIARQYNLCEKVRTWPQGKLPPYQLMANVSFFLSQEVLKIEYLEQLPGQLKLFSLFLGKWTWFAGDKVSQKKEKRVGYFFLSCARLLARPPTLKQINQWSSALIPRFISLAWVPQPSN